MRPGLGFLGQTAPSWGARSFAIILLQEWSRSFAPLLNKYNPWVEMPLALALLVILVFVVLWQRSRKNRAQRMLARQDALRSETLDFWRKLSISRTDEIEAAIAKGLYRIMQVAGANQVCWCETDGAGHLRLVYTASAGEHYISPEVMTPEQMPFIAGRLGRYSTVRVRNLDDLPKDAQDDRHFLEKLGVKSLLLIPSSYGLKRKGILGLASFSQTAMWTEEFESQLEFVANIIGATLEGKAAKDASEKSEKRFQQLFEEASVGIALETVEGTLLHVNQALCSMTGYTREDLLARNCSAISHPEDARLEEVLFNQLRRGSRASYTLEKRFIRKDGSHVWAQVSVSFLKGSLGSSPLVLGMAVDITQRKVAEERMRESETRLHSTLDVLSSRIAILDEVGTIIAANMNWSTFASALPAGSPNLNVGANFLKYCAVSTAEGAGATVEIAERIGSLLRGDQRRETLLQKHRTARGELWLRIVMTRFEETGKPRIVVSYQDVTELIRTREALEKNQERLSLALEASNTATWEWTLASATVRWTNNHRLIPDEEGSEFSGDYRQVLALVHPDDRLAVKEIAERALRQDSSVSAQFRVRDRNGAIRWILAKGNISRDDSGRAIRMVGASVDITDLKERDYELEKLAGRLIEAQEEERRRISRELHDDIGQRVSLFACELESLRQALLTHNQNYESGRLRSLQKQVDELAQDIHELSHELHSSKLQYSGLEAALRDLCNRHSENRLIKVTFFSEGLDREMPREVALCLFRIAQEAVANAVRHSFTTEILVKACQKQGRVRLTVKDFGVGFNLSSQSQGIGLTSMRERLRLVGGVLLVKSAPNEGTEITAEVAVPMKAAAGN